MLSLSVVGYGGDVYFDHLIKPQKRKRWPKAQEIHGITPADVKDERTLAEYEGELRRFFDGSFLIVGYNTGFDIGMLKASGLPIGDIKTFDVMKEAAKINGRKMKLVECAETFGYGGFEAHGSLADSKATAYCFKRLMEDDGYRRMVELEASGMPKDSARIIAAQQSSSGCVLPIVAVASISIATVTAILAVI